ncbi:MAG: rod shape-determining protein [Lachnospiraceae bacterium]|nr:rod shape-determining protein [Lachnospiraceae bacterium]
MAKVYGIDMGTSSLKIYQKDKGVIYNQKNVIALFDKKKVIAFGDEAWKMDGKTPPNIEVFYPMRSGVPADIGNMVTMLNLVFDSLADKYGKLNGAEFLIAIPTNITEVEKRAFVHLLDSTNIKPKQVKVVDRPVADALGADIDIKEVTGAIVVDMGAETVEISVLSYGGIVMSRTLSFGGKRFDDGIATAIRKYYNFVVGSKTAEQIKNTLATAIYPSEEEVTTMKAFGRDVVNGLPGSIPLDSVFVHLAINDTLELVLEAIKSVLEQVPPEISEDILKYGIHLTGGLSGIQKIEKYIKGATGIPVYAAENGACSVAVGLGKIMEDKELDIFAGKYTALQIYD